jgi:hypothetical protein
MRTCKTETITRKPEKRVVLEQIKCDLCGKVGVHGNNDGESNWSKDYNFDNVMIKHETGSNYSEGGHKEMEFFDVCPDCFETKIKPWFLSQGVQPQNSETDW